MQTQTPRSVKRNPVPTKRKKGRLGLSHVNAHHGKLKVLVNGRCRGVATKYLHSYIYPQLSEVGQAFK